MLGGCGGRAHLPRVPIFTCAAAAETERGAEGLEALTARRPAKARAAPRAACVCSCACGAAAAARGTMARVELTRAEGRLARAPERHTAPLNVIAIAAAATAPTQLPSLKRRARATHWSAPNIPNIHL